MQDWKLPNCFYPIKINKNDPSEEYVFARILLDVIKFSGQKCSSNSNSNSNVCYGSHFHSLAISSRLVAVQEIIQRSKFYSVVQRSAFKVP